MTKRPQHDQQQHKEEHEEEQTEWNMLLVASTASFSPLVHCMWNGIFISISKAFFAQ